MANASITNRLIVRLLLVFALAPLIAVLVLMLEGSGKPNLRVDLGHEREADRIREILLANDGDLPAAIVAADEGLRGARFLVYGAASIEPVATWPPGLSTPNWQLRVGYQTVRNLPAGHVRLLFPPNQSDWHDLSYFLRAELEEEDLPILAILLFIILPLAYLTVRHSLEPVRRLAHEAAMIEPGEGKMRLSEERAPAELLPLVVAINRTLDRIDSSFSAQRRFAGKVAHELRNPLAVIAARLERPVTDARVAEIRADVRGMARLIDQLLTVSELAGRRLRVDADVDLVTVARDVIAKEAPQALRAGKEIALEAPDWPIVVRGNAAAIATALRNLIDNALRYSPPGGCVTARVEEHGPCLEVADQGPGIPAADRARIFEPFWRGGDAPGAAGLGLSIVKEMADLHGASVLVDDNPPHGSRFRIRFGAGEGAAGGGRTGRRRPPVDTLPSRYGDPAHRPSGGAMVSAAGSAVLRSVRGNVGVAPRRDPSQATPVADRRDSDPHADDKSVIVNIDDR
jgi:signal transduction histidine kinase